MDGGRDWSPPSHQAPFIPVLYLQGRVGKERAGSQGHHLKHLTNGKQCKTSEMPQKTSRKVIAYLFLILGRSLSSIWSLPNLKGNASTYSSLWRKGKSRDTTWLCSDEPWYCRVCIFHRPSWSLIQLP